MPVTTFVQQTCAGCLTPIRDRYLLKVMNESWHETCLQCQLCRVPLTGSCFSCGGKLYCKHDYKNLSSARCTGCHQLISAQELVMKVDNNIFHLPCFSCVVCRQLLHKGQQFVVKDGQLFCGHHYQTEFIYSSVSPTSDTSDCCYDDADNEELDSTKGTKRPRTILTTSQRRKFKASFEINPKPCRKVRESLAAETGLTVRVVQVWFQNQRAKVKKLERKQSTETKNKDHNKNNTKTTREGNSDQNINSKDAYNFTDSRQAEGSDLSDYDTEKHSGDSCLVTSPYMSGLQDSPFMDKCPMFITNSPASLCSSVVFFNDYSSPDNSNSFCPATVLDIKDQIDHIDLVLNIRGQDRPEIVTSSSNPIDKLYSMHMSYFCSE